MGDRKYQVFVSSTYLDLREERRNVMSVLIAFDCIPVGMELFPASNDEQWALIEKDINGSDYYILIVAGRWGSEYRDGVSYTEKEYQYAKEKRIPILAFVHDDVDLLDASKKETDETKAANLRAFKSKLKGDGITVRPYADPQELPTQVLLSLSAAKESHPRPGWVRGDKALSHDTIKQMAELSRDNEDLRRQLRSYDETAMESADQLCQGSDSFVVRYFYQIRTGTLNNQIEVTWDELFRLLSPTLFDARPETYMKADLEKNVVSLLDKTTRAQVETQRGFGREFYVDSADFQTIKMQFLALGYIEKARRPEFARDNDAYWVLTPQGQRKSAELNAQRRED